MPTMKNVDWEKIFFSELKTTLSDEGMVLISDPHGSTDGFNAGRLLSDEFKGDKQKFLVIETPDTNNKNNEDFYQGYQKYIGQSGGVSFDVKSNKAMVDSAMANGWQVRSADSKKYIDGCYGVNGKLRQDYVARKIKEFYRESTGLVSVYGTAHLVGKKMRNYGFKSLTYILAGGHDYKDDPLIKGFMVKMPDKLGNSGKRIHIHAIPKNCVKHMMNLYGGDKQGL